MGRGKVFDYFWMTFGILFTELVFQLAWLMSCEGRLSPVDAVRFRRWSHKLLGEDFLMTF